MDLSRRVFLWLGRKAGLEDHPTVKPAAMLVDALFDLTNRGEIVLDPFLGSGSTLMAAERTGRCCRGVELDPLYVDVILRRYQSETGKSAVLKATGETFVELSERRDNEALGHHNQSRIPVKIYLQTGPRPAWALDDKLNGGRSRSGAPLFLGGALEILRFFDGTSRHGLGG